MALVTEVFDALSKKLQKLQFSSADSKLPVDENSCSSCYDHFTKKAEEEEIRKLFFLIFLFLSIF